ncbi:hypothetical protein SCA6_000016 [Theobroma cacao]
MSMAVASAASLLTAVRLESWKSNGGVPARPRLSLAKPTWIIRTEAKPFSFSFSFPSLSIFHFPGQPNQPHQAYLFLRQNKISNVRRERVKKPNPPCVVCQGSGRVDCQYCYGRGLSSLLYDIWERLVKDKSCSSRDASQRRMAKMVRCRTCGGSGLSYCSRCLGTGEYRYIMGFHFMKRDDDHTQDNKYQIQGDHGSQSAADRLLHHEQNNSDDEIERAGGNMDITA